jgi:DNA (cytosine-5)-methyltransferase 1
MTLEHLLVNQGTVQDDHEKSPNASACFYATLQYHAESWSHQMSSQRYTSVSLFSGIGGFDIGLHEVGFAPLACVEKDPHAQKTLQHWLERQQLNTLCYDDITQLTPEALQRDLNLPPKHLDLLVGGPPCQAFSLIGKRQSIADARGLLLFDMIRFAHALLPKVLLVEQVRGLLSAKDENGVRGSVLASFVEQITQLGYTVTYKVLRAADYGVPQLRDRLFVVAVRGVSTPFHFPEPCYQPLDENQNTLFPNTAPATHITVQDAIADLPPPSQVNECEPVPNHVDITPKRDRERINGVPEGDYLARQYHLPAHQRGNLNPKKDTTKFRRLAWQQPSLTLRGGETFYHPQENRYLTPRECLRLHGFSDDHILFGPIRGRSGTVKTLDQHRLVANAVPPPLARQLGQAIINQVLLPALSAA